MLPCKEGFVSTARLLNCFCIYFHFNTFSCIGTAYNCCKITQCTTDGNTTSHVGFFQRPDIGLWNWKKLDIKRFSKNVMFLSEIIYRQLCQPQYLELITMIIVIIYNMIYMLIAVLHVEYIPWKQLKSAPNEIHSKLSTT